MNTSKKHTGLVNTTSLTRSYFSFFTTLGFQKIVRLHGTVLHTCSGKVEEGKEETVKRLYL